MLVKWGLQMADCDKARVYLEATPAGQQVYLKFGWKKIDDIVIDLGEYGSSGIHVTTVMMRPSADEDKSKPDFR